MRHDKDEQALDSLKGINQASPSASCPVSRPRAQAPPFVHSGQVRTSHASHKSQPTGAPLSACLTCLWTCPLSLKPTSPLTQSSVPTPPSTRSHHAFDASQVTQAAAEVKKGQMVRNAGDRVRFEWMEGSWWLGLMVLASRARPAAALTLIDHFKDLRER